MGARLKALGRTPRERALLRVLLYGGGLILGVPFAFAVAMTKPYPRSVVAHPPQGYEEVWLNSEGLRLRAWLSVGGRDRPAVVIAHGLGDCLESYLPHAEPLRQRGHTVLLLDLRGHGGSQGDYTTLGGKERSDVAAAAQELRLRGLASTGLVLEGHSMGAVAVLLAAQAASDVKAVIVEAPYDTYRNTIAHHAKLLYGIPAWVPLIRLTIAFAEWRADFDADSIDCVAAASRIRAPLFVIVDGLDERMPEPVVRRIFDAHPGPKSLWFAPGVDHVGAIQRSDYWPRIRAFLEASGA